MEKRLKPVTDFRLLSAIPLLVLIGASACGDDGSGGGGAGTAGVQPFSGSGGSAGNMPAAVGDPCTTDEDCASDTRSARYQPNSCFNGACAPKVGIGEPCDACDNCADCRMTTQGGRCTGPCYRIMENPNLWKDTCPDGFFCQIETGAESGFCREECGSLTTGGCFVGDTCRPVDVGLALERCLRDPAPTVAEPTTCDGGGTGGTGGAVGTGGSGGTGGTGGTGGAGGDDTALFVPDIPTTYVGTVIEPGIEIIAHSIAEGSTGPVWMMAVRNTTTDLRLCSASMNFAYLDSSGTELSTGFAGIDAPTARLNGGTDGAASCLLPGDVGMLLDESGLASVDPASVAEVTWTIGGINVIDAVAMDILPVSNLAVVDGPFGNKIATGQITNLTDVTFSSVDVAVYAVNSVGRPVAAGWDFVSTSLPSGGVVSFETRGAFDVPFTELVSFTEGSDL